MKELLKQRNKVEEQQAIITELKATIVQQQKGIDVLTARLKDQASEIQKVNAQLAAAIPSMADLK